MIELKATARGLLRGEFLDRSGQLTSIQESSFPEEACIWLGVDINTNGEETIARMHLTRKQVRELLPLLRYFARNGSLGHDDPKERYQVGTWVIGVGETNRNIEGRIVEVAYGDHVTVQDNQRYGDEGKIVCLWDMVDLVWEPTDPPDQVPSRYERLLSDPEELG